MKARLSSHPRPGSGKRPPHLDLHALRWGTLVFSFASLCFAGKSLANPFGEKVRSGSADFVRDGGNLQIRQGSDKLIVDWKDFSIAQGEVTRFLQPGSNSAALNRVYGANVSSIYGSLRANGKVYLINPNGVFIGPSGRVDAGSFIGSTLDTSDQEFLKGGNLVFKGTSDGSIVNFGTVEALDGDAHFIARTIENHGTINAPKGTVGLAAGTEVILRPAGDEKMGVSVGSGPGKVVNAGTIAAAQAELKAAGGNLYALAIRNSGTIRATGVERKGGRVLLRAQGGTIENSGTIVAKNATGSGGRIAVGRATRGSGAPGSRPAVRVVNTGVLDASGTVGGVVHFSADLVSLRDSSQVLASGSTGAGGRVEVNASGAIDDTPASAVNASGATGGAITFLAGTSIDLSGSYFVTGNSDIGGSIRITGHDIQAGASALLAADGFAGGGTIRAFAENIMEFHGGISARGVAGNAAGGFAEVSGLGSVVFDGSSDLSSPLGKTGTLLLDPGDFTVDAAAATAIVNNLATSNVVISTSSTGSGSGDIFVNSPLQYSSVNALSLLAHRHIQANSSIQNAGTGALSLVAGWNGVTAVNGDFSAIAANSSSYGNNGGSIFIGGGSQSNAVAVGSRFGATNAAGFGMTVAGSNQGNTASAQFGFHADGLINGPISIILRGDLTVAGGNANSSPAQIGHGGASTTGDVQGSISIQAAGDLRINGGVNFSYAQIGHGGEGSSGTESGSILIRVNNLALTGGSRPHSDAQIGHGDASGDSSGARSGSIDIRAVGETTLVNGPGNNASWEIGHATKTAGGISIADVLLTTASLDYTSGSVATKVTLNQDFTTKFGQDLAGGNVTIRASGAGGLTVDGVFSYNSSRSLALVSDASGAFNGSIVNTGTGEISLVVDNANAARPNLNSAATLAIAASATVQSAGAIRIFAVDPANTSLGSFIPAQRRYNVWYGDAVTVAGVNFKIQPTLTLTAGNLTKTYGQVITLNGTEFTVSGLQTGDSLAQILTGNVGLSSAGAAATAPVLGSPYTIAFGSGLGTNLGYGLQLVPGSLSITPAPLTVTAVNQSKVYGGTLNFAGTEFATTGLRNGETIGLVDLASAGSLATAGVAGNPYLITSSNARGGTFTATNYAITYSSGALTVSPAGLTITATNQNKVYGSPFAFNGTEFTSSGLRNNDTLSSATLSSAASAATAGVAGSPYSIAISSAAGTGLSNYVITYAPGAFVVTPAPLTVTAVNQSKVYGGTLNFAGTEFSTVGLKNGETVGLVDLASVGSLATAGVAGSPYVITSGNAHSGTFSASNYSISYASGALAVTPAGLTISAVNQSKIYGSSFVFTGTEFTSSGLRNSDTISSATLSSAASVSTSGVAGSPYTIGIGNAVGSGLANYTITYVPGAFGVTPAPLTITAANQSKVYGGTLNFTGTEFSSTGLKNGETVGLVDLASTGTLATTGVAGSPYVITSANARGGTFSPGNYTISYAPGSFTVTPAPLTVTAVNQSKVYGGTLAFAGTEFSTTGLKNGETVGLVDLGSTGSLATSGVAGNPYVITSANAHGGTFTPGNYSISYAPGALTVTPPDSPSPPPIRTRSTAIRSPSAAPSSPAPACAIATRSPAPL